MLCMWTMYTFGLSPSFKLSINGANLGRNERTHIASPYCNTLIQLFFFSLSFWPFCHFLDKYLWSWMFPPKGMKKRIPFPKTCFCLSLTFWVRLNESVYIQSKNFKIILQQTHYKYFLITIESWRQDIEEPFC